MRGNAHVRFGGRPEETESGEPDHRASGRPYYFRFAAGSAVTPASARLSHMCCTLSGT